MKRMFVKWFPVAVLTLLLSAGIQAQPQRGGVCCKNIPNLTEDQKAKIEKLHGQQMKDMQSLQNQLRENKARYITLMTAEQPDMKAINTNIEDRGRIKTEMMKKQAAHQQAIRQLLTDEQRMFFDQHMLMHKKNMKMHGPQGMMGNGMKEGCGQGQGKGEGPGFGKKCQEGSENK